MLVKFQERIARAFSVLYGFLGSWVGVWLTELLTAAKP
jgi:hypothetical protein